MCRLRSLTPWCEFPIPICGGSQSFAILRSYRDPATLLAIVPAHNPKAAARGAPLKILVYRRTLPFACGYKHPPIGCLPAFGSGGSRRLLLPVRPHGNRRHPYPFPPFPAFPHPLSASSSFRLVPMDVVSAAEARTCFCRWTVQQILLHPVPGGHHFALNTRVSMTYHLSVDSVTTSSEWSR